MPRPGYDLSSEEFEDTKWVIKICKSKDRQHNGQTKKGQTTIYKTYTYIKLKNPAKNRG
jgi:hypothetical protein